MHDFPTALRHWRRTRRLSQLDLASEAEVSPRHLAFLETGRSRPSRGMVLRLAGVMALPRGDQNGLLAAAGFAPQFPVLPLEAEEMAQVRAAMVWMIDRHAPYPALILDRLWRIVALNPPAERLFGPAGFAKGASLLDALADPAVFAGLIENWVEVGHHTALRLKAESARAGGIAALDRAVAALLAYPAIAAHQPRATGRAILPTVYRMGDHRLALVSTYAQFGAAEEVALSDMKIELMFPADPETRAALEGLVG
ncbi:helix-turn-helix domain-containing protein [Tabrizicola sp.]|uniref:helix-turn-helix domain-containing protein n=1 Tax=Tabrizicola sp. TaxID=2005166 RepID=UPI0027344305|nr:helix-turn-helix transcriptional regulator [Tabrizicola sp.]MDP3196550.1 helix-turn-helix transcriptional regulator [Tabrizicola sp.]